MAYLLTGSVAALGLAALALVLLAAHLPSSERLRRPAEEAARVN